MTDSPISDASDSKTVVVERSLSHPPEKVWRVLTEPEFIEEWLQKNDFKPEVDHCFRLSFDWGAVECRVFNVDPCRQLSYSWVAGELESVITWTLTATDTGTLLRMEQTGFKADQPRFYHGARAGWPRFISAIEVILDRMQ